MDERPEKEPIGSLYRLDADHRCTHMIGGVKVSNGLAWSPDGRTLYHSDSRGAAIFRHAYNVETGALGEREVFVKMLPEWGRRTAARLMRKAATGAAASPLAASIASVLPAN